MIIHYYCHTHSSETAEFCITFLKINKILYIYYYSRKFLKIYSYFKIFYRATIEINRVKKKGTIDTVSMKFIS